MKSSSALKPFIRSPLKTLLAFLLVASASFALFSQAVGYAITVQGIRSMEGFYHCVASLDNEMPDYFYTTAEAESRDMSVSKYYTGRQEVPDRPWPSGEKLEEFASLPGVTLSDTRYMTAGLVEDYQRPIEYEGLSRYIPVLFEGTYAGYEDDTQDDIMEGHVRLKFDGVRVVACEEDLDIGASIELEQSPLGDAYYARSPYTREFFDGLQEGSRCLVLGCYAGYTSDAPIGFYFEDPLGQVPQNQGYLHVIDGLPDDYLETEDFARQKGWADAIEQGRYIYDFIYTSDMRALGYGTQDVEGRMLEEGDTNACVVGRAFLEDHKLSIGDAISVRLGDRLCHPQGIDGARAYEGQDMPEFSAPVELTIVGAYDGGQPSAIYVPGTLLQAEIPEDYEMPCQDFSVYVEDARNIESFLGAAGSFAEELNLKLDYTDGGWMDVKDSLGKGTLLMFLAMLLYILGAALALFLAAYLSVGRNRKAYAIMRILGVPDRKAGRSAILPFAALTAFAVPLGGITGLFYARNAATGTIAGLLDSAPEGYVLGTGLPIAVVVLCIVSELLFILLAASVFLWKMKKIPLLELLQGSPSRHAAGKEELPKMGNPSIATARFDIAKISAASGNIPHGTYRAVRHVVSYVLRHMGRGMGKTAMSLALAAVLAGGIGMSVVARYACQDAFRQYGVKTEAYEYAFTSVASLSRSPLVKDFYCHGTFDVRARGTEASVFMTVSNDLTRYLEDGCTVDYADGYDISSFEGTGPLCLIGKGLAKELGIGLGDGIGMQSGQSYYMLRNEEGNGTGTVENGYRQYKVIGIVDAGDEAVDHAVFAGIRGNMVDFYGMDFPVDYCEFLLADNGRADEVEALMEDEMGRKIAYAPYASYRIDSGGLTDIARIQEILEVFFPFAVAAAVLVGLFAPFLAILQSAQEAASLRILGVTKKRAWCMLALEQIMLCLMGAVLVAAGIALLSPRLFAESLHTLAACLGLYLLGGICGAAAAALQVTGHRVLALLQAKE